ncbi:MAG: DUF1882 domain-containing protein [Sulfurovum sp.]|nr:DUF1882 domain-containing protein [Sulfurovum sp.]
MKIFDLELHDDHYYIKRDHIVAKIPFGNRTFYAKFEQIREPLTPLLIQQHLSREYTIATPLLKNGKTDYLVVEYKGEEHKRFLPLIKHLLKSQDVDSYQIYQGRDAKKIQLFIEVEKMFVDEAESMLESISSMLEQHISKSWKCLPSSSLPEEYNIVTLPFSHLS